MRNFKIPFTGDETQLLPYIIICVVAVILIVALVIVSIISRKKALAKLEDRNPELETVNLEESEQTDKADGQEEKEDSTEEDSE